VPLCLATWSDGPKGQDSIALGYAILALWAIGKALKFLRRPLSRNVQTAPGQRQARGAVKPALNTYKVPG
jgi:hypothetical protein